jgi:hypothetical protein
MKETIEQLNINSNSSFKRLFPDSEINEVTISEIPENALTFFESKSMQFISPENYHPENFDKLFIIKTVNNDLIYVANQTKTYDTNGDNEKLTYFFETRNENQIGLSELRLNTSNKIEYFKNKPFVGFTKTEENHKNTGLGKRRIMMMNAFSQNFIILPFTQIL